MIATALLTIALIQGGPSTGSGQDRLTGSGQGPSTSSGQGAAGQAEADGVWRAKYTTTEGRTHEFTLTIKTSNGGISGTVSSPRGSVPITKGTVTGRDVAFTVTRRANYDEIDVTFKGAIDGDLMQLKMQVAEREPVAVTARRETGKI